jgi:hypothetical protein
VVAYCVGGDDGTPASDERPSRRASPQKLLGGLALACFTLGCGATLYTNLAGERVDDIVTPPKVTIITAQPAPPVTVAARKAALARPARPDFFSAPSFDTSLLDAAAATPPVSFSPSRPMKLALHTFRLDVPPPPARVVASVPLPTPRPADLAPPTTASIPPPARDKVATAAVSIGAFERLFGKRESGPELAYAPADGGVTSSGASKPAGRLALNDGHSAIYDISERTVHLPDGTKLEAHSGLGPKMDDPRYVHVRMHGATPPHVYDLAPREALFHGVEALRMHPVGGAEAIHGRNGILTHSYLLGPNGDSNGCVSFKDYDAFLRAYKAGKVKRMIVVASLDNPQFDLALLDRPLTKRAARVFNPASEAELTRIEDDRYALVLSEARALRTNSSARSFSSLPE